MRHIEKLKKIFTCCDQTFSCSTNGEALDELVAMAETGTIGAGGNVGDNFFYYKDLPIEPINFTQGMVSVRLNTDTREPYEYIDETSSNRIKCDEYINCNNLFTKIIVPSDYSVMLRAFKKDDDGAMVALTNLPEFNGCRTIKDIIYQRLNLRNAGAYRDELLAYYKQNNLYLKFCVKKLDNSDFTPENNEVIIFKYADTVVNNVHKEEIVLEDYLHDFIYHDYKRSLKNIVAINELVDFINEFVNSSDFDGTIKLPRRKYVIDNSIILDSSKVKIFDGNNAEFIVAGNIPAFIISGSLGGSNTANPNTLNSEIMNNEPNTILRNCVIRSDMNENGEYLNFGTGINITGAIKAKVENCYIHHLNTGIKLEGVCRDISICNNNIYAITGNGISLDGVNIHQLNINSNFISYCMNCLYVRPTELANLQLNGNDIEISTYPDGYANARCLNFDISSTSNNCFEIEITGNTIQGHSNSSNLIQFIGGSNPIQNVSIVGNHISNSAGTAIKLKDCKGFTVHGNTMKDISEYIFDLDGTNSYINIIGNTACNRCDKVISTSVEAILEKIRYINNLTTGNTLSVLSTQKTDVVIEV